MNCHVYLSARKKVKKIKKKIWKKYHSINLFIFDFSIVSKKFKTEIQAKTLSLPRQIDENFYFSFFLPLKKNLEPYYTKNYIPLYVLNSVFLKSANLCCDSHICLPSAKINEQFRKKKLVLIITKISERKLHF